MTGHLGLIGSFLLKRLEERGDTPVLLIDIKEGNNVLDINEMKLNEKVDVFIHLASFCKINKSIEEPPTVFENNSRAIENVMEFCKENNIPKVVFTSSSRILSPEKNPYTASKIYGEELVKGYSQCFGLDYVIIRPSTVYGPFNDKTKRLIDIFIMNALLDSELKIFGDENKTLDFTYIDDFLDGFLLAMEQKNQDFDISSGTATKICDVADLIINLSGKGKKNFYSPEVAQPQEVLLDISKIKELGYNPKVNIEDGVRKTFEWYKENLDSILLNRGQDSKNLI
jgi:UDP-glucose 4-epimerase